MIFWEHFKFTSFRIILFFIGELVVTSTQNHRKIHLFNIIKRLNKFKIFEHHQIGNFSKDLRKQVFLSAEKTSERSRFLYKNISQN